MTLLPKSCNIGVIPILMKMVLGILHLTTTQFIVTGKAKF